MKNVFYLSGSVFFLSVTLLVALHLGQTPAVADWDNQATGDIVGYSRYLGAFWDKQGLAYDADAPFDRLPAVDLPAGVEPSQVCFVGAHLILVDNRIWKSTGGTDPWLFQGTFTPTVVSRATTWGELKHGFRR
jgi:hypothetical protein